MVRVSSKFASEVKGAFKFFLVKQSTKAMGPTVRVRQGALRGAVCTLPARCGGEHYYSFKGIPYARPPLGKLRFKAPAPAQPWLGVREAAEHGAPCPQVDMLTGQRLQGSEDCLFLNVYTKSLLQDSKLPVMVFIHGGGFMSGSGDADMYGPQFLLQHDVVLVTVNYRLEMLGFLCLDSAEVPGNAGMKDQVAALRWVRDNIDRFGGDPGNVTLFGESAGAASVTYHMLSPMSAGLFHRAIAQSGVCIADWARGTDGKERAIRAAKFLGHKGVGTSALLDFLQNVPVDKLVKMTFKTMTDDERHRGLPIHFAPVVEKRFDNTEAFLTKDPLDSLLAGDFNKVPLIVGYNSAEGLVSVQHQAKKIGFLNENPSYFVPREVARRVPSNTLSALGDRVKCFYSGERDWATEDLDSLAAILSDVHFVYNCHRLSRLAAARVPVFMYRFECDTQLNAMKRLLPPQLGAARGACHADDLFYLFSNAANQTSHEEDQESRSLIYTLTKLWTDFAKTGEPTPDGSEHKRWPSLNTDCSRGPYVIADSDSVADAESVADADCRRVRFWNKVYRDLRR
ncbi:PREDICTED: esterase B1-like [Papilio xuthus]|uniref:Carboxylic ester hydrolase n=1 Tax=Papilio xuthus TaxID=66420 RepID=A0AAJ6ZLC6_PAPXU|nr:PREDICTED: esterase B1-like [Papilio xuthus]